MSNAGLLLTVVILQQGFLGAMWMAAAAIGLARSSAWHWGAAAAGMAACLAGVAMRDSVSTWLGFWLANSVGVAAMPTAALLQCQAERGASPMAPAASHISPRKPC